MPSVSLIESPAPSSVPVTAVTAKAFAGVAEGLEPPARAWIAATGFNAKAGSVALLPNSGGALASVLFGLGDPDAADANALIAGRLATGLPAGAYHLAAGFADPGLAALAIALGGYDFAKFRKAKDGEIRLAVPAGVDAAELRRTIVAVTLVRDLVNTPANRMGPADLAIAIRQVGEENGATVSEIRGEELLVEGFPLIHAVGAAAADGREPRLLDLTWGDPNAPKVTLVGKGVCFDTGGLDIKPSSGMILMKKDMGGAANALALASMIMGAKLRLRLRLLVPAVENSISGAAFRPSDIFPSRKGLSVEIGNTDAEGRLVLADALTLASEEEPDVIFDFATLTGAARVALGPDLPAIFTNDEALAADIAKHGQAVADPSWRLPLWAPYASMLETGPADINNAGQGGFAGSITAALFLQRFVGDGIRWMHADIYAWNPKSQPARPEGGEAQTIRALYALLKHRYPPAR